MSILGVLCKLGGVVAVVSGSVSLDWLWTPIGIVAGLVLMIVGSTLAPRKAERSAAAEPGPTLYARDGKPYGPQVAHQSLPSPSASWTDGI